ncbi:iron-containing alcohol dehydrogenase [Thermanaerosceptrum fracticalcis]|uniref:Iron-containing alcohol dehydrogenase n=1 Tax=Thermanaerosceptrum fracticalcis TaxID=1712410 RepID=A0A7G6E3G3_THEFR
MINAIVSELNGKDYQRVIAVGGGTVIDVAKILILQGVEDVLEILYGRSPVVKDKKLVVIPTTCGTGSEVTNISIMEDTQARVKKGIVNPVLFPDQAVLIPSLLKGLPYRFFAFSSIDALIHAVESYLAPKSNPFTELFSVKAIQDILGVYKKISEEGQEAAYKNIGGVLLASTYAGIAFANTGVAAVHALSYPLGGGYHVSHGEANYAFFSAVMQVYNQYNPSGKIANFNQLIKEIMGLKEGEDALAALDNLLSVVIRRKQLREYGMKEEEIEMFTTAAMAQERLMKNNYVPLTWSDVYNIYKSLY